MMWGEVAISYPDDAMPDVDGALATVDGVERRAILDLDWGRDDALTQLFWLDGGPVDDVDSALAASAYADDWEIASGDDDALYLLVHGESGEVVRPLYALIEHEPMLLRPPIWCEEARWRFGVVGTDDAVQRAHDVVREHADVDVERLRSFTPDRPSALAGLTDRQREALETAVAIGFYEESEDADFDELGEALDCGKSAANALLRRAEARIVETLVGE